jgi:predicted nuclease with TOPRIM domain
MNDELYKALSKGYADGIDQLDALDLIEELQNSVMSRNDLLAELARNVEGRQERIDTLEAEVARLREALMLITGVYDPKDYGGNSEVMFSIAGAALQIDKD